MCGGQLVRGHGIRLRAMIGKLVGRGAQRELEGQRQCQKKEATDRAQIMPDRGNQGARRGKCQPAGGADNLGRASKDQRESRSNVRAREKSRMAKGRKEREETLR